MDIGKISLLILAFVGFVVLVLGQTTRILQALHSTLDAVIALLEKLGEVRNTFRRVFRKGPEVVPPELRPPVPAPAPDEDEPASVDSN